MMTIIGCKSCGDSHIGLGNVYVDVTLSKSQCCDKCRRSDTEKQNYFFCSLKCFYNFIGLSLHKEESLNPINWKN